jgi:hypothetical protein
MDLTADLGWKGFFIDRCAIAAALYHKRWVGEGVESRRQDLER